MARAKVSSKGQITIPAEIRRFLGVARGDAVLLSPGENNTVNMRLAPKPMTVRELAGSLGRASQQPADLDAARIKARERRAPRHTTSREEDA